MSSGEGSTGRPRPAAAATPGHLGMYILPHPSPTESEVLGDWAQHYVFEQALSGKAPACNAGDTSSIPGLGRSSGRGNGNSLQCSCLGSPMDRRTWQAIVQEVARVGHNLVTEPAPQDNFNTLKFENHCLSG